MDVPAGFEPLTDQGPFLEYIGPIHVDDAGQGPPTLGMRVEDRHANHRGTVQGGLLATFVDFALARAIDHDDAEDHDRATVSLTVDYFKPAEPGDWIESRASVDRVGSTLAFANCAVRAGDRELVRARAVFAAID